MRRGSMVSWPLLSSRSTSSSSTLVSSPFACKIEANGGEKRDKFNGRGWWRWCVPCALTAVALTIDLLRSFFLDCWTWSCSCCSLDLYSYIYCTLEMCVHFSSIIHEREISRFLFRVEKKEAKELEKINWCSIVGSEQQQEGIYLLNLFENIIQIFHSFFMRCSWKNREESNKFKRTRNLSPLLLCSLLSKNKKEKIERHALLKPFFLES